jgi:hypothetical protein
VIVATFGMNIETPTATARLIPSTVHKGRFAPETKATMPITRVKAADKIPAQTRNSIAPVKKEGHSSDARTVSRTSLRPTLTTPIAPRMKTVREARAE